MVMGYLVVHLTRHRSNKVFLTAFGVGFLLRLILLVVIFILYSKLIQEKDFCFALSFGLNYMVLSGLEVLLLWADLKQGKMSGSSL